jgi:hypothetical protein
MMDQYGNGRSPEIGFTREGGLGVAHWLGEEPFGKIGGIGVDVLVLAMIMVPAVMNIPR